MSKFIILLAFSLLISSCGSNNEPIFHNYHEIKDRLIVWNQIFELEEDYYLIYFYSERCGYCNDIKQEVLNYYFNLSSSMYFVCTDYDIVTGPAKDLVGLNNIEEFYIFGTPFLIEVKEQSVTNYYAGKEEILAFISI